MSLHATTVWLTGLPASGKTSIAKVLCAQLRTAGAKAVMLDGDELRRGVCADLGFSEAGRNEHIRRVGAMACLLNQQGVHAIASVISPYAASRDAVRVLHQQQGLLFYEVFVDTPLKVCMQRDPKGLYTKARAGLMTGLTGLDAPYEVPAHPDMHIQTVLETAEQAASRIMVQLESSSF